MTAERDPMTLDEISYSSLGVEERSDEAPRDGRAGATLDPEVVAKPMRRQFSAVDLPRFRGQLIAWPSSSLLVAPFEV